MNFNDLKALDQLNFLLTLMNLGLLLPEKACPKCKEKCKLRKRNNVPEKYAWRCTRCSKYHSVKVGSFFEMFKSPILTVLEVVDYWAKDRKQCDTHESLNLSKPVIIKIFRYLRQLCYLDLDKENFRCGGQQKIVEIDESVFNKVKYNKGKDMVQYTKKKQLWVFGMKERSSKKCLFQVMFYIMY
jgi:hypothetical protein